MVKIDSELFNKFTEIKKNSEVGDSSDTNLLDVIHLSENDHTKILWRILRFKRGVEYPYLNSFLRNVIGLNEDQCMSFAELQVGSGTQCQAISMNDNTSDPQNKKSRANDAKGYIDLLLKGNNSVVIIENKVCNAGDSKYQLARYYHSFVEWKEGSETINDEGCKTLLQSKYPDYYEINKDNYKHNKVFVVYLTLDGKEPSEQSKQNIKYISATYLNDNDGKKSVLSWLKEDVMPNMPHLEHGNLLQSLKIYIDYIEHKLLEDDDKFLSPKHYKDLFGNMEVNKLFTEYHNVFGQTKLKEISDETEAEYGNCLRSYINAKLNKLLAIEGWTIHWTTGYIMLFKDEWCKYGTGRLVNLVHWEMLKDMDKTPDYKWSFHVEESRLAKKINQKYQNLFREIFHNKKDINKSGQIQAITDFNKKPSEEYLLCLKEDKIRDYFLKLILDNDFQDKTAKAIELVNRIWSKEIQANPSLATCSSNIDN